MPDPNGRPTTVRHPVFARLQPRIAAAAERAGAATHRQRLLAGAAGRALELGAGRGITFPHYPTTVTHLVAVEPEPHLRHLAATATSRARVPVSIIDGTADALPLDDACVDVGVVSLVLCSVPDQADALAELRRVIKPGGQLRFYEHVAADHPAWLRRQRRAERIWPVLAGGCHLSRHTERSIRDAGFQIEDCDRFLFQPCLPARLSAPHILGSARRRP